MAGEHGDGPGPGSMAALVLLAVLLAFLLSGVVSLLLGPIHPWPGSAG